MLNPQICYTSHQIDEYVNKSQLEVLLDAEDLADLVMEGKKLFWPDVKYPPVSITRRNAIENTDVNAITVKHYATGYNGEELGEKINEAIRDSAIDLIQEALNDYSANPEVY